ncbi:MAG TPA: TonB-dependent receptor [Dongiaceae bacterium]|nr:TonB-dependent receptor [Dongiaceae bacterium]
MSRFAAGLQLHADPSCATRTFALNPLTLALRAATLGLGIALATVAANSARAQEAAAQEATKNTAQTYAIPAGPLAQSLNRFASDAGINLSFDPALVRGKLAPALQGRYSVEQGLQLLLSGSGLRPARGNAGYSLEAVPIQNGVTVLEPVNVLAQAQEGTAENAYRAETVSVGVLGKQSLQNTPYSIEVFSRELLDNRQARSIADVTKTDAAVSLASNDLLSENNAIAIRGLNPDFDTGQKLDGLNLRSRATDLPLEHIETVEILKGASGFLYGFGAPGGIINYTQKRPTDIPKRTLSTQVTDSGLLLLHGDIGGRLGEDDRFGYRVNAVTESGDSYINDGESKRGSASAALDWRITPDLIWQVDMLEASHKRYGGYWAVIANPDGSVNWDAGKPLDPIDGDKRLAPEWTRYGSEHETWGTDLRWQMSEHWSTRLAHRQSDSYRLFNSPALFSDADGNYTALLYNYNNHFESEQTDLMVTGDIQTGAIRHDLVLGVSSTETISSNAGPLGKNAVLGSGNLSDPVDFDEPFAQLPKSAADEQEYSRVKRDELYVSDTLHAGQRWDLILGARHGTVKDEYADYDESKITPTLALIHRPVDWVSVYASYVEALEQGEIAGETYTNAGKIFDPLTSEQYEVGVKVEQADWSVNAALFQLQRGLFYTNADGALTQDGEALYEGLELAGKARFGRQWLATASAMWLEAKNENTGDDTLDGEYIQGIAREQFRLYGEYSLLSAPLTFSAGMQYEGKRPVDPYGEWYVGSVVLFDAGARYETQLADKPLTLRLNIDNLTNEAYWLIWSNSNSLTQGVPLTAKLGLELDF